MLLRRLQVFFISLLIIIVLYHFSKKYPTNRFQYINSMRSFPLPPIHPIYIFFPVYHFHFNQTKPYKAYQRHNTRLSRRKYNYSFHSLSFE
jgi:hypothetical protein